MSSTSAAPPGRDAPPRMPDLERERATFTIDVPERFNSVEYVLDRWAEEDPDAVALVSLDATGGPVASQTVAELVADSRRAGNALAALGVGPGDRVLVMLPRVPAWYTALLGAIRIGAVPMPAPSLLTPRDIAHRLERGAAMAVVADPAAAEKVDAGAAPASLAHRICATGGATPPAGWLDLDALLAAADPVTPADPTSRADPMLLYFTSGTVGPPKMVVLPQAYGLGHIRTARFWQDLRPGDRHWTISDTGWAKAAYGSLFGQWHERATVVQVALGRPDADTILDILAAQRHHLVLRPADPLPHAGARRPDRPRPQRPAPLHQRGRAAQPRGHPRLARGDRPGGLRRLRPDRDHDRRGERAGAADPARLHGQAAAGLRRRRAARRRHPGRRRRGRLDRHPRRAAPGRACSTATTASPRPRRRASAAAGTTPATARRATPTATSGSRAATTTSSPRRPTASAPSRWSRRWSSTRPWPRRRWWAADDPQRTQIVCAFVILAPGAAASDELAAELQEHCKRETAPYKYPREIHFVDELPKTVSGKIRRVELREWLREGRF